MVRVLTVCKLMRVGLTLSGGLGWEEQSYASRVNGYTEMRMSNARCDEAPEFGQNQVFKDGERWFTRKRVELRTH